MGYETCNKDWSLNTIIIVEVTMLLDLVKIIKRKLYQIIQGKIDISVDIRKLWLIIHEVIVVLNHYN